MLLRHAEFPEISTFFSIVLKSIIAQKNLKWGFTVFLTKNVCYLHFGAALLMWCVYHKHPL
jgi:hypothetical protein